ncbi:MAG: hypothetical protein ACOC2E_04295 [Bacteroidota bacterium]
MHKKFIINEGRLKLDVVDQHVDIASDHTTTNGGGWWHIDEEKKIIWLYGRSMRFGSAPQNELKKIIQEGKHDYPGYTFYHSFAYEVETAKKLSVRLNP